MKKIVKFVIVIGILLLIFQFGMNYLKKEHYITYKMYSGKHEVAVEEHYIKKNKLDYYFLNISVNSKNFVIDIDNSFNKQKKILHDITVYKDKKNDLMCIYGNFINEIETDIVCNIKDTQYEFGYIKDNYNVSSLIRDIPNFNENKYKDSTDVIDKGNIKYYRDNFLNNESVYIYNYNKLLKFDSRGNTSIKFADYDVYENKLGILIDKYYVIPIYENKPMYNGFIVIDVTKEKINKIYFDEPISTNIYINGVVDNKLYIFDKSNLIQYEIDPIKRTYKKIGDKEKGGQYYDGSWSNRNIYDFVNKDLLFFKNNYISDATEIFETDKYIYYCDNNNIFYKVYRENKDKKIYLFKSSDAVEIKAVKDNLYFMKDTSLYRYNKYGIKKLITYKEFKYNYENIYSIYLK